MSHHQKLGALRLGAVLLGLGSSIAQAAPAPPYAVLLREAQTNAPRLIESGANVRAAQGLAEQAGAIPNPTLSLESEDIGVNDSAGISQRQNTLSFSQPLELGGKRSARAAAGKAEVGVAEARALQAQADFAYDLALAYATAEAGQVRVSVLTEDLERAREVLRVARALVEAGKEADVRAIQAQAAQAGAEADLASARADAAEALANLSSLTGAAEPYSSILVSLLGRAEALRPPLATDQTRAPGLAVAQADREAAARRLRVERARSVPDLTLSIGARTYDASDETGIVAGVSVPLPLFDRNRGAVKAANAQFAAAEARLNGARLQADGAWTAATAQTSAGQVRLAAAAEAEAATREGYRLADLGYQAGKTSLMELLAARRALAEAQTRLIDARLARVRAEAQLARLTGRAPFGE